MKETMNMIESSKRGIILSLVFMFSLSLMLIPSTGFAAEGVNVKSISFENSTIMQMSNSGNDDVYSFRIWLGADNTFKSFTTENGWTGQKTPQGVIVFTTTNPVKPNESVKFGVKTDDPKKGVNWKALDKNGKQINIGITLPEGSLNPVSTPSNTKSNEGIFAESSFRIIPDKPNAGGDIRVTGNNFGVSQQFEFFLNTKKLGSFVTDNKGYFMTTFQIPENQAADRVDFIVKDSSKLEKKVSLRLGSEGTKIPESDTVKLTVKGIPNVMHRGDFLEISGTAQPESAVTASILNPDNQVINTRTAEVDAKGVWKLDEPIIVPLDTPFGKYSAEISDGRETITKKWTVESSKVIVIAPTALKFAPGETMKFNGTALPNQPIEVVLEDPLGEQKISDIFQVGDNGTVEFDYKTTANVDKEGTWTLTATQGKNKELIYAGLGQLPTIPVNLAFNKLNYKSSEDAVITFTGKPSEILNLLIIDPGDKPKGDPIPITLTPDGKGTYVLNLDGYSSGVYTAVASKGSAKSTEIFTVGLQTGSGDIKIDTTKLSYERGEPVLILGETKPNVLLTLTLIDPDGNKVKSIESYSNKLGKITEDYFRIPSEAKQGTWTIRAQSGSNFYNTEFDVTAVQTEGLSISVEKSNYITGVGKTVTIRVLGAEQTVNIDIVSSSGEIIDHLSFPSSGQGKIIQPWIIPPGTEPGTYTFKAKDPYDSAETTFEIE